MTASLSALTHLRPSDAFRMGEVVPLNGWMDRVVFAVKEFFSGSRSCRDQQEFQRFYEGIKEKITVLGQDLGASQNLDNALPELQILLKVQAKIANNSWVKNLKGLTEYADFQSAVKQLNGKANGLNLAEWALRADVDNRKRIVRWIQADSNQRRFAAHLNTSDVPYRGDEIPAGSVLITDPNAFLLALKISGKKPLWKSIVVKIKSLLCHFFNGMPHTHAEIALGDGEFFDLDKAKDNCLQGQGMIKVRKEKKRAGKIERAAQRNPGPTGPGQASYLSICGKELGHPPYRSGESPSLQEGVLQKHRVLYYATIVQPNQKAMVEAHNERFPELPVQNFQELWAMIDREARASAPLVKASIWDILKTGIKIKRTSDYDSTAAWQPGIKRYGCSGTVSALFSKYGIDIGQEFNKVDQNVKPADFLKSKFFQPFYLTSPPTV